MGQKSVKSSVFSLLSRHYVDTAGKNTAAIKAYIQNQLKEDLEYDQMSLVEYIDPFTGEPVKKSKK